jgi:hypothetical protein
MKFFSFLILILFMYYTLLGAETAQRYNAELPPLSYELDDRGLDSRQGPGIFLFTTTSRSALGHTQASVQWITVALFLGGKAAGA